MISRPNSNIDLDIVIRNAHQESRTGREEVSLKNDFKLTSSLPVLDSYMRQNEEHKFIMAVSGIRHVGKYHCHHNALIHSSITIMLPYPTLPSQ